LPPKYSEHLKRVTVQISKRSLEFVIVGFLSEEKKLARKLDVEFHKENIGIAE
jgi:hypothetical protein